MDIKSVVKDRYGKLIGGESRCCSGCPGVNSGIPSFGVGDPVDLAGLKPGERVLDVGSGAGGNCVKAAKIVGENGFVSGLDAAAGMLGEAVKRIEALGLENLGFVEGDAEDMPFPNASFDVVISDCVINLIPDKGKVFREIFRVLKPGGRAVISDVLSSREFPDELKQDENLWCGCISGALPEEGYIRLFEEAGFSNIQIPVKKYSKEYAGITLYNAVLKASVPPRSP